MDINTKELLTEARQGSVRAIGKILSILENKNDESDLLEEQLYQYSGNCYLIGVTGPPGAGKSTLVSALVDLISQDHRVAIIAVDPSSPYSGGAVLGDRIRFKSQDTNKVFFRSMAARGSSGGLAASTAIFAQVFAALGFDYCIIETIGVGQSELDIAELSDTCLVVLVPGMGDEVQSLKAGILEIANIFVINKSDYPRVDQAEKDLIQLISLSNCTWKIPIIKTIASKSEGILDLWQSIKMHQTYLIQANLIEQQKIKRFTRQVLKHLELKLANHFKTEAVQSEIKKAIKSEQSPSKLAKSLIKNLLK